MIDIDELEKAAKAAMPGGVYDTLMTIPAGQVLALIDEVRRLRKLDAEAATHVESVIALRSAHFTGDGEYVGWRGLGKALREDYDEMNRLRALLREAGEALRPMAVFAQMLDTKPLKHMDDEFYGIHVGTEFEASLRTSDFRSARSTVAKIDEVLRHEG